MEATELRHIVLFGFRAGTRDDEIDEIARRFGALADEIPGIGAFDWGPNNSPEGKTGGHSHCFMLTFVSEAARDAYLPHPKLGNSSPSRRNGSNARSYSTIGRVPPDREARGASAIRSAPRPAGDHSAGTAPGSAGWPKCLAASFITSQIVTIWSATATAVRLQ